MTEYERKYINDTIGFIEDNFLDGAKMDRRQKDILYNLEFNNITNYNKSYDIANVLKDGYLTWLYIFRRTKIIFITTNNSENVNNNYSSSYFGTLIRKNNTHNKNQYTFSKDISIRVENNSIYSSFETMSIETLRVSMFINKQHPYSKILFFIDDISKLDIYDKEKLTYILKRVNKTKIIGRKPNENSLKNCF